MRFKIGDEDQYGNGDDSGYINDSDDIGLETSSIGTRKKKRFSGIISGKHVLVVLLVALVVYFAYTMIAGPRIDECKKLVNNLQTSCNNLDLLGLADCMNPTVRNAMYIAVPAGAI